MVAKWKTRLLANAAMRKDIWRGEHVNYRLGGSMSHFGLVLLCDSEPKEFWLLFLPCQVWILRFHLPFLLELEMQMSPCRVSILRHA